MALPFARTLPPCSTCQDRRHIRTATGWTRCVCARHVVTQQYIRPALRGEDTAYPVALDAQPPLPLTSSIHAGNWDAFRRMAWRSLVHYEPEGLSYDVVTLSRLIDIDFNREDGTASGYSSLAGLEQIHLLILLVQSATPIHKWTGYVLAHTLDLRRNAGLPYWVFTSLTGTRFWDLFKQSEPGVVEALKQTFAASQIREWR